MVLAAVLLGIFGWYWFVILQNASFTIDVSFLQSMFETTRSRDSVTGQQSVVFTIGLMSDSHGQTQNIIKSLEEMLQANVDLAVHLGDFTAAGEEDSFSQAYHALVDSGLPYTVMPGDHDFNWFPEYSRSNYEQYFGSSYSGTKIIGGVGLIFYENSVSDTNNDMISWLKGALEETSAATLRIFFSPKPLANPYFSTKVDSGGQQVISLLREEGIKYAVSGDTHIFAEYQDDTNSITFVTVGALGEYKSPLPQWVLMKIYADGSVTFEPKPLVDF